MRRPSVSREVDTARGRSSLPASPPPVPLRTPFESIASGRPAEPDAIYAFIMERYETGTFEFTRLAAWLRAHLFIA
jgi:hypothetical protein